MLAKLIALVAHEIVTEYRKLDAANEPPVPEEPGGEHRYDPASTTALTTERADGWDHDTAPPVRGFGFRANS